MSTPSHAPARTRPSNRLLAALPPDDYLRLAHDLELVVFPHEHVLVTPSLHSTRIYFPGGGVCALTQTTSDGQVAGIAVVGNEGVVGLAPFGGDPDSGITASVAIAEGPAHVMDIAAFNRERTRGGALADLIERYTIAFTASLMQSIACNALHPVEQRCARCLLEIRDRVGRDDLPVTHAALAAMLGVRRATVTLCAGAFDRAGLLEHGYKHIVVRDPRRLEEAACECYRTIRGHFGRLLP